MRCLLLGQGQYKSGLNKQTRQAVTVPRRGTVVATFLPWDVKSRRRHNTQAWARGRGSELRRSKPRRSTHCPPDGPSSGQGLRRAREGGKDE
ncbi:hypothetical protein E2C01_083131 [Portunus trituberculatus]|uniref:Uncharacterized protein n=1 Tax=Portunus trituberculatus TaxID=210409 RepID=A0A5B7IWE1_PORTR|nr:hypothetical protein [Portunus trituberculatus]